MTYTMTCTCGDTMSMDAESRSEAVMKFKDMMTQEMLDSHWTEKHSSDTMPKPSLDEAHAMIDQMVEPKE